MKIFKVPFDVKREEKIFGGYLSLRQVLYLMLSASSFFILSLPINVILQILFITLISTFSLLCAFLKINEINFDKLFIHATKYLFRKKNYTYVRCCD